MPDEDLNSNRGTQISQNNQVVSVQSGDDFVLDFGDEGSNAEQEASSIETNTLKSDNFESNEGLNSAQVKQNKSFFVEEEKEESRETKEVDVELQGDKVENDNDFEISFEDMSSEGYDDPYDENSTNTGDSHDQGDENENMNFNLEEGDDKDDNIIMGDDLKENNLGNLFDDEVENDGDQGKNEDKSIGNTIGSESVGGDEANVFVNQSSDEDNEQWQVKDVDKEGFLFSSDFGNSDAESINEAENGVTISENNETESITNVVTEDVINGNGSDSERNMDQDAFLLDDNLDVAVTSEKNNANVNSIEGMTIDDSEKSLSQENSEGDLNNFINVETEHINQPEIGDFLGGSSVDVPLGNSEESVIKNQDNVDKKSDEFDAGNLHNNFVVGNNDSFESNGVGGNNILGNASIDNNEGYIVAENMAEKSESFSEDFQTNAGGGIEFAAKENVFDTNNYTENVTSTNGVTSTLSLDQILDTELSTNPQFADNSKAVPINVQSQVGLFGNRMMGIVVGIGIILLSGLTMVLAFPLRDSDRKPGSVVNTGEFVDEYIEHDVADVLENTGDTQEEPGDIQEEPGDIQEEPGNIQEESEQQDGGEIIPHTSKVTVQQPDFPDVGWEDENLPDEGLNDSGLSEPIPYICEGEDCEGDGEGLDQVKQLEMGEIIQVVLDFKSQAEIYYSQGDEMQDKKLVKYALQLISSCNNYQRQVETGEGLDELTFLSFKTKGESLLDKMESYLIGEDYSEILNSSDMEKDFEGKEELRNYIYERDNY